MAHITALYIYPVKSCRGISLQQAQITSTGFQHDREWMIVRPDGKFVTQRDDPRLALIATSIENGALQLCAPEVGSVQVPLDARSRAVEVICWRDRCAGFDSGDEVAQWLSTYLGAPYRLVRFDTTRKRPSDPHWTGGVEALNQFSDGYPWLLISEGSLADLNRRLSHPLPMNRFRPNIVVDGLDAYAEDEAYEFSTARVRLRRAKACTRCIVTTTDQSSGARDGEEPLRTLRGYRLSRELKGVLFGQNLILIEGLGERLHVGERLDLN